MKRGGPSAVVQAVDYASENARSRTRAGRSTQRPSGIELRARPGFSGRLLGANRAPAVHAPTLRLETASGGAGPQAQAEWPLRLDRPSSGRVYPRLPRFSARTLYRPQPADPSTRDLTLPHALTSSRQALAHGRRRAARPRRPANRAPRLEQEGREQHDRQGLLPVRSGATEFAATIDAIARRLRGSCNWPRTRADPRALVDGRALQRPAWRGVPLVLELAPRAGRQREARRSPRRTAPRRGARGQ